MEPSPPNAPASAAQPSLRETFIATANALTVLYKRAASVEPEARAAGERAAYLAVLEWAARRSTAGEPVTAQDVVAFATQRIASQAARSSAGQVTTTQLETPTSVTGTAHQPTTATNTAANGGDTAALASGLGKLQVNPRKRPRVDSGDSFLELWREEGLSQNLPLQPPTHHQQSSPQRRSPMDSPSLTHSTEYDISILPLITSNTVPPLDSAAARKLNRKSNRDSRPGRRRDEE